VTDLICSYYTVAGVSPTAGGHSPRSFAERAEACARAGYRGIGIHLRDYRALREQGHCDAELLAIVRDTGMVHVEVEFLLNWFADGPAGEQARRDEETLYHMAQVFDARVMFLSGDLAQGNSMPFEELIRRFCALADRAASAGVKLGVEPCAWTNIGDLDEALRLVEGSGARNAGLFLDVWHLARRGLDYERLREIDPALIFGVQLDDVAPQVEGTLAQDCLDNRLLPGEGVADTERFVRTLFEIGFGGPLSVEVLSHAQRALPLEEAARVSHDAARSLVDEAARQADCAARAFSVQAGANGKATLNRRSGLSHNSDPD
jgi:sugar phosphate isomerase/epimerase